MFNEFIFKDVHVLTFMVCRDLKNHTIGLLKLRPTELNGYVAVAEKGSNVD